MRQAFEAAFEKAELEAQNNTPPEKVEPLPDPTPADPVLSAEEGKTAPPKEDPTPQETTAPTDKSAPKVEGATPAEEDKEGPLKAPYGWTPTARETWGNLPKAAQQQIIKREREVEEVLRQSATARQAVTELNRVLEPHRERMMASGVQNPIQMLGTMLDAERRLSSGDPQTRAATIANLIKGYGVDIEVLDGLLAGQVKASPHADIERLIDQRLAPVNQILQQQEAFTRQQRQEAERAIAQTVNTFSSQAEFIEDVRLDMADLLDMAAARGQTLSLEEAYKKACAIHPEVSKVMADRERQQQLMGTQTALQQKKNAAVSITGVQRGATVNGSLGLRDQIAAAWDDQMSR